jgi:phenylacetate-coenzyme A ligase PaaK-like adenylate-forming protein
LLIEVVDPASGQPLPDGQTGAVVLTHLNRRGTVLLRYALGDLSVRSLSPCPACGAVTDRLVQTPSRHDALLKVKGMLVHPQALIDHLDSRLAARPYLLSVQHVQPGQPLSGDRLLLQLEGEGDAATQADLAASIKAACGVTPEVEFVPSAALAPSGAGWKAKKFIDRRGAP